MLATPTAPAQARCVLVVEDEPDIAQVIRLTLEHDGFATDWAASGEEALERIDRGGIDLVLLDIRLPGMDGHDVCRRLRLAHKTRSLPVIMLTSLTDERDMITGLSLGADDYVRKPFSGPELVARAHAALRRGSADAATDRQLRFGELVIDQDRRSIQLGKRNLQFTLAEYRLLLCLAMNRGRALSRRELLPHVVGEGVLVIERNIDVHIRNIRKKLGPVASFIQTVRRVGYYFDPEA